MEIRPARPSDALGVARTHVESWQDAYRDIVPDAFLDSMDPQERASRYAFDRALPEGPFTLLAMEEDLVAGFATIGAARPNAGIAADDRAVRGKGELLALYLHPSRLGSGIGTSLHRAAIDHLSGCGYNSAILWVLEKNHRARRFYEKSGWQQEGTAATFEVEGTWIPEIRYEFDLTAPLKSVVE